MLLREEQADALGLAIAVEAGGGSVEGVIRPMEEVRARLRLDGPFEAGRRYWTEVTEQAAEGAPL